MIKEFTPIRFLLIMMIFLHHVVGYESGGPIAVSFFFVLSGFCMMHGYRDRLLDPHYSYRLYLKHRLLRIYPLHIITLLVAIAIKLFQTYSIGNWRTLFVNASLLQSWIPNSSVYFSYNSVSWYLSSALLAYAIFPIIGSFIERVSKRDVISLYFIIILSYLIIAFRMPNDQRHALLYVHPVARMVDFLIGVLTAKIYSILIANEKLMHRIKVHAIWMDLSFVSCMVFMIFIGWIAPSKLQYVSIIYWMPIIGAIAAISLGKDTNTLLHRMLRNPHLSQLTACSFSFMMWHLIISNNVPLGSSLGGEWGGAILKFVHSYAVALISYKLIEKKLYDTLVSRL